MKPLLLALGLALVTSCASTDDRSEFVTDVYTRLWSGGKTEVALEAYTGNFRWTENLTTHDGGPSAYLEFISVYRTAFPDLEFAVKDTFSSGDRTAVRWVATGTNTGSLLGAKPTGKPAIVRGITIYRMEGDLAAEEWTTWDEAGMMRQLGLGK